MEGAKGVDERRGTVGRTSGMTGIQEEGVVKLARRGGDLPKPKGSDCKSGRHRNGGRLVQSPRTASFVVNADSKRKA